MASGLKAQDLYNYSIRESIEYWQEVKDPIVVGKGNQIEGLVELPAGFNFRYDNQSISRIYFYDDGFISFNNKRSPFYGDIPYIGQYPNILSYYSSSLVTDGELSYKITGTSPFRVLIIQHLGAKIFTEVFGRTFDVQVKIFETSNEIQVIYGPNIGLGSDNFPGSLYISGNYSGQWINIEPQDPIYPSKFYQANINPNTTAFLDGDIRQFLPEGKSYTFSPNPSLAGLNPDNNELYVRGNVYSEPADKPFVRIARTISQAEVYYNYKIEGPINDPNNPSTTIYTGVNDITTLSPNIEPVPQPLGSGEGVRVLVPHATGIAGRLSDGALDLTDPAIKGGTYRVTGTLRWPLGNPFGQSMTKMTYFNIALQNDLAITIYDLPLNNIYNPYALENGKVPIRFRVANFGYNDVTKFKATARIYKNQTPAVLAATIEETYDIESDPLKMGDSRFFMLPNFQPTEASDYFIEVELTLLDTPGDDNKSNNILPREGAAKRLFSVGYTFELGVESVFDVNTPFYTYRPIRPYGVIKNNGTSEFTELNTQFTILNEDDEVVFQKNMMIPNITSGIVNRYPFAWDEVYVPTEPGEYTWRMEIYPDDPVPSNDVLEGTFTVLNGLAGDYTVGVSDPKADFATISDAIDALYKQGVAGAVNFILIDEVYNEGSMINTIDPAIDLTGAIINTSATNKVTFKPFSKLNERGNIVIRLNAGSGVGIRFGQNLYPTNQNSIMYAIPPSQYPIYANSTGFIGFDGGANNSIVLELNSTAKFQTVVHLQGGASNFFVKNCILEGKTFAPNISYDCELPEVFYSGQTLSQFSYDENYRAADKETFTTGVLLRNIPPMNKDKVNEFTLDTINISHNIISGNDIRGFGYGIVSLGIGQLREPGKDFFHTYLNEANMFENNMLYNLARAGVFLGYEHKTHVKNNRIYNIENGATCDYSSVAGIIAGGRYDQNALGYYNVGLNIEGNEISDIRSTGDIYGILVDQSSFTITAVTPHTYPELASDNMVYNNIIYGLKARDVNANKFGIRYTTSRASDNWANATTSAVNTDFFTRKGLIAYNTILMNEDNIANEGAVIGAVVENANGLRFYSNAIAMEDPVAADLDIHTLLYYRGMLPFYYGDEAIDAERNAYWISPTVGAEFIRFSELDLEGNSIYNSLPNEFMLFDQWQQWTGLEPNSVYGNWTKDYTMTGSAPYYYRVKQNPAPLGSILNNRAVNIAEINYDIDNQERGSSEERYDIGADEFVGRQYGLDLEITNMLTPAAYKAQAPGMFSEAHYFMTTAPIPIKVMVRNTGKVTANNQSITLTIDRESEIYTGEFVPALFGTKTIAIDNLYAGESREIDFQTDQGLGQDFVPQTYTEFGTTFAKYLIPEHLQPMVNNVTPIYRITVTTKNDENNANNTYVKYVRFYLLKSNIKLLISTEDIEENWRDIPNISKDLLAKNLNLDSLVTGFERMGLNYEVGVELSENWLDIFDRNAWEPRSINYNNYRSLWWVDGHDTRVENGFEVPNLLPRRDKEDIIDYLASGTPTELHNLVISSQEMIYNMQLARDSSFNKQILNAQVIDPINPLGKGTSYDGKQVTGGALGRDQEFTIKNTEYTGDMPTMARIIAPDNPYNVGSPRISYIYNEHIQDKPLKEQYVPTTKRGAGIINSTVSYNYIYNGVDWRHWANTEYAIRAAIDFFQFNKGNVVPINLAAFDAAAVGKRVDIVWETESEQNAAYFEVEKALYRQNAELEFSSIINVKAEGNSVINVEYGPYADEAVAAGNKYVYRLKMVDADGTYAYSDEKLVEIGSSEGSLFVSNVKPNPAASDAKLNYSLPSAANVRIEIYDTYGQLQSVVVDQLHNAGEYQAELNLSTLPVGNYSIVIKSGSEAVYRKAIVVR